MHAVPRNTILIFLRTAITGWTSYALGVFLYCSTINLFKNKPSGLYDPPIDSLPPSGYKVFPLLQENLLRIRHKQLLPHLVIRNPLSQNLNMHIIRHIPKPLNII